MDSEKARLDTVHRIGRAVLDGEPMIQIAAGALKDLRRLVGTPRAVLALFDMAAGEGEWVAVDTDRPTRLGAGVRYPLTMAGDLDALRRGVVQIVEVASLRDTWQVQNLAAEGIGVYAVIPLRLGGELVGSLNFGAPAGTSLPSDSLAVASAIADLLAIVIQQARLKDQVLQSEKLATMGDLLAGVAHELNNPLSIITGNVALLIQKAPDDDVRARGRKIETAANRCARIIRNFLAMARRRPPERGQVALHEVLQGAVEILAYELRVANIAVNWDLAEHLPLVWADAHQIQQGVVNLLTNAHHAMRTTSRPRRLSLATRYDAEHRHVRIVIADTGPGMSPAVQARIFEPFFTTKPPGQGTGLGLSLCRRIIESHDGLIRVESVPGQGTTFVIELPLGSPPASVAQPAAAVDASSVRGKTILVVEDEPDIADLLAETLALDGHHVETAPDGAAALAKIAGRDYDLIISDCGMPVLGGAEFYGELTRAYPRLANRIIFVSGDTLNRQAVEFLDSIDAPRLEKPLSLDHVRSLVRRVLQQP